MPTFRPHACLTLPWLPALLALLLMAPVPAAGQAFDASSAEQRQAAMAQQARQQTMERLRSGTLALEGAIDPNEYLVGPGDVFSVSVGGALATETPAQVSADGLLVIPEVGSFPVAGLTLAEARTRVQGGLRRIYRNVETQVALAQPRQFFVHVSGAVDRPGRHVMLPIGRVEDAVAAGMNGESPIVALRLLQHAPTLRSSTAGPELLPALRNVEVRHANGTRRSVDLLRYYATGDVSHNPYLRDGDAVFVPGVERRSGRFVYVERERRPSDPRPSAPPQGYDHRSDDTITSLLLVEGGPELLERSETVRLTRTDARGRVQVLTVDVAAIRAGTAVDVALQPLDRILIPQPELRFGMATLSGAVRHPGTYPIVEGQTTLPELVQAAGGILPDGFLRGAYLERPAAIATQDSRDRIPEASQGTIIADATLLAAQRSAQLELATFENARLSDLPFGSRQYLVREMLHFQRVSLDLSDDPATLPAIPLRDGDVFVVPVDPDAVLVIGQVRHPGFIAYRAGATVEDYIREAGGRGPAATGTYVREAGSGYLRPPDATPLRSGDMIFVDRTPIADTEALQALSLHEQQIQYHREQQRLTGRIQVIQTGLSVVSTAIAVVTTYLLIRRN